MKRRRTNLRWWLWNLGTGLGTIALCCAAIAAWIHSEDFQQRARSVVRQELTRATGEQASVGGVRVQLWPPAVSLEGVHLWDAKSQDSIVTIERLRAPISWKGLSPGLGDLAVSGAAIHLHLVNGRLVEFDEAPSSAEPLRRIPWQSLSLSDGTFRLGLEKGEIALTKLSVSPQGGSSHAHDISATVSLDWDGVHTEAPLNWQAVRLGPEAIEVPSASLHANEFSVEGQLSWPLASVPSGHAKGSIKLKKLRSWFGPEEGPTGLLQFDTQYVTEAGRGRLTGSAAGKSVEWHFRGRDGSVRKPIFGDFDARFQADRDGLTVDRAAFKWGDGEVSLHGKLSADGVVKNAHVTARALSLARIFKQLDVFPTPWVDLVADAEIEVEGALRPLDLRGSINIRASDFRASAGPNGDPSADIVIDLPKAVIKGSIKLNSSEIVLTADELTTPRSRGQIVAHLPLTEAPIDIAADFRQLDLRDLRPLGGADLEGIGRVRVRIFGPPSELRAEGSVDIEDFSVTGLPYADKLSAKIHTRDFKRLYFDQAVGRKGTTQYNGSISLDFRRELQMLLDLHFPEHGRVEDVVGVFIDIPGLGGELGGHLHLQGPLHALGGEATLALQNVNLWGEHFEQGSARGFMDQGLFTLDDLHLERHRAQEGLSVRGSVGRGWSLNAEIVADGFSLERLDWLKPAQQPLTGKASLIAHVGNTLFDPAPNGRLTVTHVRYFGQPVSDSVIQFDTRQAVLSWHGNLVGQAVTVDGTLGLWGPQPYQLSAKLQKFPAHLPYPTAADGRSLDARVSGNVSLSGHFGGHPSPVALSAEASEVLIRWGGRELRNVGRWRYEQNGATFALQEFGLKGGPTNFDLSASGGGGSPLRMEGRGKVELELLKIVVPGLTRAEGIAEVSVLATRQNGDVSAEVDVTIDGAPLLRHESFPGSFEDVRAHIRADRSGYELSRVEASLGGGIVRGDGRIEADAWIPTAFHLTAEASEAQVQWVDWLPPAIGHANIRLDGPSDGLLLAGVVHLDEMTFTDRIDWEDWVIEWQDGLLVDAAPSESPSLFSMDIAVLADKTIRLRNNVADGRGSANLRFIGDTNRPGLVGHVNIQEGQAFLQDREFNIEQGRLAFQDPWTWDPDVDFDLVTDITSKDRRYRVSYLVRGPFSNWFAEAQSDPPLPQADLNALLWFGVTADDLEGMGALPSAVGQGVADLLLADFLVKSQAAQDLRGELPSLLDRIDVATGVNARGDYNPDPRILVGKTIGKTEVTGEIGLVGTTQYWQWDLPITEGWSLAIWYASQQRARNLPIGGAYGFDLKANWNIE